MATTKIRIECRNNADARRMQSVPSCVSCKHNGGKTVIVLSVDVPATTAWLEDAPEVSTYKVEVAS